MTYCTEHPSDLSRQPGVQPEDVFGFVVDGLTAIVWYVPPCAGWSATRAGACSYLPLRSSLDTLTVCQCVCRIGKSWT